VNHPQFNKIIALNPGGTSINKTIDRAELAGVFVVLTDNSILYPQRMKQHKHAKLL
jgi:hypothetical protein